MEERSKNCDQGGGKNKKYQQLEKLWHSPWVCSDSLQGRMEDAYGNCCGGWIRSDGVFIERNREVVLTIDSEVLNLNEWWEYYQKQSFGKKVSLLLVVWLKCLQYIQLALSMARFLNLGITDIEAALFFADRVCHVHCRIVNSNLGLTCHREPLV